MLSVRSISSSYLQQPRADSPVGLALCPRQRILIFLFLFFLPSRYDLTLFLLSSGTVTPCPGCPGPRVAPAYIVCPVLHHNVSNEVKVPQCKSIQSLAGRTVKAALLHARGGREEGR